MFFLRKIDVILFQDYFKNLNNLIIFQNRKFWKTIIVNTLLFFSQYKTYHRSISNFFIFVLVFLFSHIIT